MKKATSTSKIPTTIDEYIDGFPVDVQKVLKKVRVTIKKAAPQAEEAIKYQLPTYVQNGNLVHFGAFKQHLGFYPTPSAMAAFEADLSPYKRSKGSVQFPFDQTIPYELITRMVKFRVSEVTA